MSYLFLFSPSGAQSSKPGIFIVTFYDRSFSSAAASLLLRPFFAFLTVFLHNCSAMRELPPSSRSNIFFIPIATVIFLHFSYRDVFGVALKLLHKKRSFCAIRGRYDAERLQLRPLC